MRVDEFGLSLTVSEMVPDGQVIRTATGLFANRRECRRIILSTGPRSITGGPTFATWQQSRRVGTR